MPLELVNEVRHRAAFVRVSDRTVLVIRNRKWHLIDEISPQCFFDTGRLEQLLGRTRRHLQRDDLPDVAAS